MLLIAFEALPGLLVMSGALITVFAAVFMYHSRREAKRLADAQRLGQELDLSVMPKDSFGLARQLQQFDLFSRERSSWLRNGRVSNIMRGKVDDTEVFLFEYSYMVSTGKTTHRVSQTVFFANDKDWYLPNFRMKPETWWHKVLQIIGLDSDINFHESASFSEKFWLTSDFEQLVRQQFTPALQDFLTERPPVHLEGSNYYLIAYKPGKILAPAAARTFFEHCCELVKMLKKDGKAELLNLAEWRKEKQVVTPEADNTPPQQRG